MKNSPTYTHEQRPGYQRENIDLALKSISQFLWSIWVETSGYDPNLFTYIHNYKHWWKYDTKSDLTYIDSKHCFNTKVHIHEWIHAFSSDFRYWQLFDGRLRTGFHIQHINNHWSWQSHNSWFNEWITQLITLQVIRENFSELQHYRKRYKRTMTALHKHDIESRKVKLWYITAGCKNTGWYRSYYHEMRLVNSILDLVAFERSKWWGDFKEHRETVWNDLVFAYFLWDFKILRSILKEADSSWLLKSHIQDLKAKSTWIIDLTDSIRDHIKDIFDPRYRMSPIPTKLW